jgi:hypothetical protein
MKAAVACIQEKANKGHSPALAVSYSLRHDKHHSTPTVCSSPLEMLQLWKSCVLPHFLLRVYLCDASQVQTLQASLNRSLSATLHVYGHPTEETPIVVATRETKEETGNLLSPATIHEMYDPINKPV